MSTLTEVHHQGQQGNQDRHIQSSFLSLPTELRLAIYEHLIPNNIARSRRCPSQGFEQVFLRHDEQPCYPAILRINHQIYNEVIGMWYGTARFQMVIAGRYFHALGVKIDNRNAKLPSNFRLIRSLSISIMLHWPPKGQPQNSFESLTPWTQLIADCLSTGPYKLFNITISTVEFYSSQTYAIIDSYLNDRGKQLRRALEWNLGPLRMMRGVNLQFDNIEPFCLSSTGREGMYAEHIHPYSVVLRVFSKMERIRASFLNGLVEEVLQND